MSENSRLKSPLVGFGLVAILLIGLRVLFAYVTVPVTWGPPLNIASSVLFVGLPIVALFLGAARKWDVKTGMLTVLLGVVVQVGCGILMRGQVQGDLPVLLQALGQTGLLIWCLGLGATVACLIKEKNLIIPVALFLAGFDIFLVFMPTTPTSQILAKHPEVFQSIASQVPQARITVPQAPTTAKIYDLAFIGPADLLFTAVFFALLFRFDLRPRTTVKWLIPVMIVYLLIVLCGIHALPALVPIGGTVLLVNLREFKLTGEEKKATWGVAIIALGLAAYGVYQGASRFQAQHAVPSRKAVAPGPAAPAGSPAPTR